MNDFFYEARGKEKIRELQNEGKRSQWFHRSSAPKAGLSPAASKLIFALLGTLGLLGLLVR